MKCPEIVDWDTLFSLVGNPRSDTDYSVFLLNIGHVCFLLESLKNHTIAYFQTEEGWVQVGLLWDKQNETHIVRKSPLRLGKISVLVSTGPILNKIQPFKNLKINSPEKIISIARHHQDIHKFLCKFWNF